MQHIALHARDDIARILIITGGGREEAELIAAGASPAHRLLDESELGSVLVTSGGEEAHCSSRVTLDVLGQVEPYNSISLQLDVSQSIATDLLSHRHGDVLQDSTSDMLDAADLQRLEPERHRRRRGIGRVDQVIDLVDR